MWSSIDTHPEPLSDVGQLMSSTPRRRFAEVRSDGTAAEAHYDRTMGQQLGMDDQKLAEILTQVEFRKCKEFAKRARQTAKIRQAFSLPAPGSPLAIDDQPLRALYTDTKIQGLSATVKLTALMAEEQLLSAWPAGHPNEQGMREVWFPPYSVYSLLRGSLEASAHALWLLEPDDSAERLSRFGGLIRYSQDQYLNVTTAYDVFRDTDETPAAKAMNDRITDFFDTAGIELRNYPNSVRLIEKDGRYIPTHELTWSPKVAWQVASGVAHSLPWSIEEAIRVIDDPETRQVIHKIDAESYRYVYQAATVMFETLVERIEELQTVPSEVTHLED